MEKEKKDYWYVYPGNDEANDAICNTMTAMKITPKETTIKYGGINWPVLETDTDFIDFLATSRFGLRFKYQVFWEDEFGTIRIWKLHLKVVKKRAKAHRRKKYLKTSAQKKTERYSRGKSRLNKNEFEVISASADRVEIKVGNVHLVFQSDGKKMGRVSKFDPFREIYDEEALRVPDDVFNDACQQAAQIMKDKRLLAAKKQLSLFNLKRE